MAAGNNPPEKWNRAEVSRYLVPFLRMAESIDEDGWGIDQETVAARKRMAKAALYACPVAYRQLSHVYHHADDQTYRLWFGGIDCDDALLASAFDLIDRALPHTLPAVREQSEQSEQCERENPARTDLSPAASAFSDIREARDTNDRACSAEQGTAPPAAASPSHTESLTEDAAFRRLFHVSHTYTDQESGATRVRRADLLIPFLEMCRASDDRARCRAEDLCLATVQRYFSDYCHALSYYRENYADDETDAHDMLLDETHLCMQLMEQMIARADYEKNLADRKAALEYERGGLGWFGGAKKKSIDAKLLDISISELELAIADEQTRLRAVLTPLENQKSEWEDQLAIAPLTAFRRKKELRRKISQVEKQIQESQRDSQLPALNARLAALRHKQKQKQNKKTDERR